MTSLEQTRLLIRTFFDRLFESELMPDGLPQVQLVVWSMLLAATPTTGYSMLMPDKYQSAQFYGPLALEFAADRMILITLTMTAMGVVGLVIWDGVFPDRRDVRILGPLPVSNRCFVMARLGALGQVFLLFATPLCVLQSLTFPMVVAGYGDAVPRVIGVTAHLITVVLACAFVFAALIAVQCLLLLSFGTRAAQHVSVAFQLIFAVGLAQMVFLLPALGRVLRDGGRTQDGLSWLYALPATWFFGLYQVLSRTGDPRATGLAQLAVGASVVSLASAIGLYAATYGVLSKRALEGPMPRLRRISRHGLPGLLHRLPPRGFNAPLRVAIRQFAIRTLARSRYHRMVLAVYGGIALAIVVSSGMSVVLSTHAAALWRPNVPLLSMPLVLQFLMLIGIRVIVAVPSEPKARWVFRLCEPADRNGGIAAARDMMMVLVVYPTTGFALAQGLIFWNPAAAISHAVFCGVLGRLFAELLLANADKLPFACTYFPGKSRVFTLWPLYIIAFFLYTVLFAEIDRALTTRPNHLMIFCASAMLTAHGINHRRQRMLRSLPGLRFEEEDPDAMFQGFNLSEAMASAPKPPRFDNSARAVGRSTPGS